MSLFHAIMLAIIEGLTEFLPVSSTGHMIIYSSLAGISGDEFTKLYTVDIQFGCILSVLVLYYRRFLRDTRTRADMVWYKALPDSVRKLIGPVSGQLDFYLKLFVAFLPAAVIGFLLNDFIDSLLENVVVVAISLVVGGVILVFIDRIIEKHSTRDYDITFPEALRVGFFQCIAMIPGVSRSASTIIGGMTQGLTRQQAAEFSFFLAVPTMAAATGYKLLKTYEMLQPSDYQTLLIGNGIAFLVGLLAIRGFVGFLNKYGFKVFGYYRIVVGLILLGLIAAGVKIDIL
ncbi:undecaprenyl-diphosphate phosphatase [Fibrivirga algicola]|uniref:Undecaprenyl-diphosphatase n=1 Tax=Fibrivirga algicola TaxID=2950420 RepID=A0ABX0QEK1_9BACT|nr:undecaprenyl-diphosphate phosphatase [Fibrivirga algicola]ARK13131.1 UDP-diphosphatase [Fibrella sp. ES10-3-2-2]NID09283.1 undecaprenyl-diphosphate phosphatase [Fibrivirga algicola]